MKDISEKKSRLDSMLDEAYSRRLGESEISDLVKILESEGYTYLAGRMRLDPDYCFGNSIFKPVNG